MAYKLLTEVRWEDGYYRKYYCQSATDLTSLPTSPTIAIGSEALLEDGSVYKLSNANAWAIYSPATSTVVSVGQPSHLPTPLQRSAQQQAWYSRRTPTANML